jgi:zinc/manganese transport system substrate-binding protein
MARLVPRLGVALAVVAVLAGVVGTSCSGSGHGATSALASVSTTGNKLNIIAAENFWGSIASQLAGEAGDVTSIVTDPNADPHSYESSSDDARSFATADYVVVNGAGYDPWANKLLAANPSSRRKILVVADLLGKKEGDNPHFWYDPDYVTRVIDRIESDLKALRPASSAYLEAQRSQLDQAMAPYRSRLREIRDKFSGTPVASTESIFVSLADWLGLKVASPPDFMNAVAEGNDPPAPSVVEFQDELTKRQVRLFVFNEQTVTDVTTSLKKQAANSAIPTLGVTETIQPPDATFQGWFEGQLEKLQNALNSDVLGK